MFRRSIIFCVTVHSTRAIPFAISSETALTSLKSKYQSRWFLGANSDFIEFKQPAAEFIPFFLCNGRIAASFVGQITYRRSSTGSNGKLETHTTRTTTQLLHLNSTFHENRTQIYGGYKYNNKHIYTVCRHEENPGLMKKVKDVDVSVGSINLFEVSVTTLNILLKDHVLEQATKMAETKLRQFHPDADSISVDFKKFEIAVDNVFPCFVPCYVVPAAYDGTAYTMYVSGWSGAAGGPYLINSLAAARISAAGTLAIALLLTPNKPLALFAGSFVGVAVYYAVFFATRGYPAYRRDQHRRAREAEQVKNVEEDVNGYRPSPDSQRRVTEEYRRSSFWSSHKFEQKTASSAENVQDKRGYYKMLDLAGNESINEIRSAYRRHVLMDHPDAGGTNDKMTRLNDAYRVLRDPATRAKYDRGDL